MPNYHLSRINQPGLPPTFVEALKQRARPIASKKKPRNSSPRPRPLFAHVTHAQIVEQKLRSH